MSETFTTTDARPSEIPTVESIRSSIAGAKLAIGLAVRRVPTRLKVGNIDAFAAWCDRQMPLFLKNDSASPSFSGVPIVEHPYLPWYSVVLTVGDEVRAVFDLRDPSPTPKEPS